jgi:hypothetical protein
MVVMRLTDWKSAAGLQALTATNLRSLSRSGEVPPARSRARRFSGFAPSILGRHGHYRGGKCSDQRVRTPRQRRSLWLVESTEVKWVPVKLYRSYLTSRVSSTHPQRAISQVRCVVGAQTVPAVVTFGCLVTPVNVPQPRSWNKSDDVCHLNQSARERDDHRIYGRRVNLSMGWLRQAPARLCILQNCMLKATTGTQERAIIFPRVANRRDRSSSVHIGGWQGRTISRHTQRAAR